MNRNFTAIAVGVLLVSSVTGGLRARSHRRMTKPNDLAVEKFEAERVENGYAEAVAKVEEKYAGEIDYEKATQAAIQGMLFTLDPHSVYFPYSEFKKLKEDQDSRFYGIGVQILRHDDGVYIQSAVEGTPAARAGLRYGDRIIEVDGKDARDWTGDETAAGWQKHYLPMKEQLAQVTAALLNAAAARPGMRVLDLASGTGVPALNLAKEVGPGGKVIATDLSELEGML